MIIPTLHVFIPQRRPTTSPQAPRLVVVFVVGGTTYEEAKAVADLNAAGERNEGWSAGMRIVLGGTQVHNSATFMRGFFEIHERVTNTAIPW